MTQIHLCIQNIVGIYCSDPYQTRRIRLYQNTNNHLTYLILLNNWLHRCWWRMLETKCVDDNYKILVTVLALWSKLLIANIHFLFTLASGANIWKSLPTSKLCHQNIDSGTPYNPFLTRYQNADPCQSPHFFKHGPHFFKHGPHLFKHGPHLFKQVRIFFKHGPHFFKQLFLV